MTRGVTALIDHQHGSSFWSTAADTSSIASVIKAKNLRQVEFFTIVLSWFFYNFYNFFGISPREAATTISLVNGYR